MKKREPLVSPENEILMKENYLRMSNVELENMFGYRYNAIYRYARALKLGKRPNHGKGQRSEMEKYRMSENYDPQTYVDPYITQNVKYTEDVYSYRMGYQLKKDEVLNSTGSGQEFVYTGKSPKTAEYFL